MVQTKNGLATKSAVFSKMLRSQLIATIVVTIIAFAISGLHAGSSALLGGLSVVVSAFIALKVAEKSNQNKDATVILINLLKAEAVKIILIVILLFIVFKVYPQLIPLALIAGLAASALFSGAAITKLDDETQ